MDRIGRWNDLTHAKAVRLGPYQTEDIGRGSGMMALVDCNACGLHLIQDGHDFPWPIGASMPFNGVRRLIRNPYAVDVTALYYEGWNSQLMAPMDPVTGPKSGAHRHSVYIDAPAFGAGTYTSVAMLPSRGAYRVMVDVESDLTVKLVRNATANWLTAAQAFGLFGTVTPTAPTGFSNPYWQVYFGPFGTAELTASFGGHGSIAAEQSYGGITSFTVDVNTGTALVLQGAVNTAVSGNAVMFDLGDWNHEDRVR